MTHKIERVPAHKLADRVGARFLSPVIGQWVTVGTVEYQRMGILPRDWTVTVNGHHTMRDHQMVPVYYPA